MNSIDDTDDLELLAAFIDGRLSDAERARALALLAKSDDALEIFGDTLRAQHSPALTVVPISRAHRWRQWRVIVPVAAAAALAFLVVPKLIGPGAHGGYANELAMELAHDPRFAGALGEGWDERGWTVTRGAPMRDAASMPRAGSSTEDRLAFRLGARSLDLQVALQRGDTALGARFTNEIVETLGAFGFQELVSARYTDLKARLAADAPARSVERALAAERELRDLVKSPLYVYGQWAGAAELAARTHDAAFFTSSHGTRFLRSSVPASILTAEDADALQFIDARVSRGLDERALDDVHARLQSIIRRRGS
jgi:hypothetical protein